MAPNLFSFIHVANREDSVSDELIYLRNVWTPTSCISLKNGDRKYSALPSEGILTVWNRVQTQCFLFIQFSRLIFTSIFFLNFHQFESLLSLNPYNTVQGSVWLILLCFVLHRNERVDTKFYHSNFNLKKNRKHAFIEGFTVLTIELTLESFQFYTTDTLFESFMEGSSCVSTLLMLSCEYLAERMWSVLLLKSLLWHLFSIF